MATNAFLLPRLHCLPPPGIFGMNMRSTLEMSVGGFWGVTISIVVGCFYIFLMIMRYTQKKRIL